MHGAALLLALAALAACTRKEPDAPVAAGAADDAGGALEKRPRNATDYQPMFPDQTRAPGVSGGVKFKVEVLAGGLTMPWAVEPLPEGRLLVTEKPGRLLIVTADGKVSPPVAGLPGVHFSGQAGLLDVALDPGFADNHVIYFCYSEARQGGSGPTLARATLVDGPGGARLEGVKQIFRQMPTFESDRQLGARIAFGPDGKLYLALGERGEPAAVGQAQDLASDFGKVVRLNPDGSIPADNPFKGHAGALPEVWSYGHRNPQAAAFDTAGRLWVIEHGPRGGDELNLIVRGANYGWPVISYGIDYSGAKVGEGITHKEGMEQPVYYWDPVIAPSGMIVYHGAMFPEWEDSIFVGGLVGMKLVRLQMKAGRVTGEEWLLQDVGRRIRDVQQDHAGAIYVLTESGQDSTLLKLTRVP